MARQLGAFVVGLFIFFAVIAALSRLLQVKEIPSYIDNLSKALGNLYRGVFGQ